MTMLKVLARKGSCARIEEYLDRDGRAVALDSNFATDSRGWSEQMDAFRRAAGKDEGRTYYHAVISPDPRDNATLEQVRDLTRAWVSERYPGAMWVAEYHDEGGRVHAHVIINSVRWDTGNKIHMDRDWIRDDAMRLQELSRERGLSHFTSPRMERTEDGWLVEDGAPRGESVARDRERQRRVRAGRAAAGEPVGGTRREPGGARWSWLEDTRVAIDECVEGCADWEAFVSRMEARGFGVRVTHRKGSGAGVTFTHPKAREGRDGRGGGYRVKGWKLDREGGAYSYSGILSRLQPNLADARTYARVIRPRGRERDATLEARILERGRRRPGMDLQRVADACAYVREAGLGSADELEGHCRALGAERRDAEARCERAQALLARARDAQGAASACEAYARYVAAGHVPSESEEGAEAGRRAQLAALGLGTSREDADHAEAMARGACDAALKELEAARRSEAAAKVALDVARRCGMARRPEGAGSRLGAMSGRAGAADLLPVRITLDDVDGGMAALRRHQEARAAEVARERWVERNRPRAAVVAVGVRVTYEASGQMPGRQPSSDLRERQSGHTRRADVPRAEHQRDRGTRR